MPTLVDHLQDGTDFVVTESKAIQAYMVNSRAPGHSLYPTEPKARAVVDNRMYYDSTVVFARVAIAVVSIFLNLNIFNASINLLICCREELCLIQTLQ